MGFYKKSFPSYDRMRLFIRGQGTVIGRLLNSYPGKYFVKNSDDFTIALTFLAAFIIRADRTKRNAEYNFARKYFIKACTNDEKMGMAACDFLEFLLKTPIEYDEVCVTIRKYVTKPAKLQLVHFLCDLACSDNEFNTIEYKRVKLVGYRIGLSKQETASILNSHAKSSDKAKTRKRSSSAGRRTKKMSNSTLRSACEILGILISCTKEELKKAYRKLARLHHPDKVSYLGPIHIKKAQLRFDEIADAYQYIKLHKGY
jgi:DnaJ like chaperone protein